MNDGIDPKTRKLAAKRVNENLKLLANSINTAALTILGAALILPMVNGLMPGHWTWIGIAGGLHLCAQAVLRWLKSEE